MGRRPEGVHPIDLPVELGYRCPVCMMTDERLHWSEYNTFVWCSVCDYDYPTVMCINLRQTPAHEWERKGRDAAVTLYLDQIEAARNVESQQRNETCQTALELLEVVLDSDPKPCRYGANQQCLTHPDFYAPCLFEQTRELLHRTGVR